jgi:hypothetical protein
MLKCILWCTMTFGQANCTQRMGRDSGCIAILYSCHGPYNSVVDYLCMVVNMNPNRRERPLICPIPEDPDHRATGHRHLIMDVGSPPDFSTGPLSISRFAALC